jgi:hypothetical protein
METYENLVGNQENWAQYITNVEMLNTPFLDWLPVGDKPVNVIYNYQADRYAPPRQNSHVDGKPWTNFKDAGEGRARLKALIQWFDNTVSVSKLTEDVSNIAGVPDEMARDIPKKLKEMGRDMETNWLEDWDCREDDKAMNGYLSRAVGSWISSTQQALYPVDPNFLTPSGQINSTASGSLTENMIRDIIMNIGITIKSNDPISLFCGPKLKRAFSDFQFYLPSSTSTVQSAVHWNSNMDDQKILRSVDTYIGDTAPMNLILSYYLAAINGTSTMQQWRGYFLHQSRWEVRWNQKPKVYRPEFKGGSYEAAMDAICMLVCRNPKSEGKYAPTA